MSQVERKRKRVTVSDSSSESSDEEDLSHKVQRLSSNSGQGDCGGVDGWTKGVEDDESSSDSSSSSDSEGSQETHKESDQFIQKDDYAVLYAKCIQTAWRHNTFTYCLSIDTEEDFERLLQLVEACMKLKDDPYKLSDVVCAAVKCDDTKLKAVARVRFFLGVFRALGEYCKYVGEFPKSNAKKRLESFGIIKLIIQNHVEELWKRANPLKNVYAKTNEVYSLIRIYAGCMGEYAKLQESDKQQPLDVVGKDIVRYLARNKELDVFFLHEISQPGGVSHGPKDDEKTYFFERFKHDILACVDSVSLNPAPEKKLASPKRPPQQDPMYMAAEIEWRAPRRVIGCNADTFNSTLSEARERERTRISRQIQWQPFNNTVPACPFEPKVGTVGIIEQDKSARIVSFKPSCDPGGGDAYDGDDQGSSTVVEELAAGADHAEQDDNSSSTTLGKEQIPTTDKSEVQIEPNLVQKWVDAWFGTPIIPTNKGAVEQFFAKLSEEHVEDADKNAFYQSLLTAPQSEGDLRGRAIILDILEREMAMAWFDFLVKCPQFNVLWLLERLVEGFLKMYKDNPTRQAGSGVLVNLTDVAKAMMKTEDEDGVLKVFARILHAVGTPLPPIPELIRMHKENAGTSTTVSSESMGSKSALLKSKQLIGPNPSVTSSKSCESKKDLAQLNRTTGKTLTGTVDGGQPIEKPCRIPSGEIGPTRLNNPPGISSSRTKTELSSKASRVTTGEVDLARLNNTPGSSSSSKIGQKAKFDELVKSWEETCLGFPACCSFFSEVNNLSDKFKFRILCTNIGISDSTILHSIIRLNVDHLFVLYLSCCQSLPATAVGFKIHLLCDDSGFTPMELALMKCSVSNFGKYLQILNHLDGLASKSLRSWPKIYSKILLGAGKVPAILMQDGVRLGVLKLYLEHCLFYFRKPGRGMNLDRRVATLVNCKTKDMPSQNSELVEKFQKDLAAISDQSKKSYWEARLKLCNTPQAYKDFFFDLEDHCPLEVQAKVLVERLDSPFGSVLNSVAYHDSVMGSACIGVWFEAVKRLHNVEIISKRDIMDSLLLTNNHKKHTTLCILMGKTGVDSEALEIYFKILSWSDDESFCKRLLFGSGLPCSAKPFILAMQSRSAGLMKAILDYGVAVLPLKDIRTHIAWALGVVPPDVQKVAKAFYARVLSESGSTIAARLSNTSVLRTKSGLKIEKYH
uniref:Uncharacterized protein n=1 Tax=Mucochytrium quahogii TaxID=96639 RepID=A0A7S2SME4_9STRA|mmetsp:Transcript_44462/g.71267  ORF Transcript_44462/g.71267 Transcript_44462/m.71267 type:complete len:1196 (-) Transcript_44462:311-3898(-)|eukprot:CAMPEP_0203761318 /NCGR_PEP_ID=MMETSP0098-20131031/14436_1 /ASSEMBLY_ACC=CAM_ASM_000208 /TAXON_ID=96639 /ORGANISM=" , Strain NY0313808BC1" /LENGTH=1195 /DNA_ID=CAMNT_0050655263 /DNA_START=129 /DNA_END=3716 /DNA_ORIENTATION=-